MVLRAVPNAGARRHCPDPDLAFISNRIQARRRWIIRAFVSLTLSAVLLVVLVVLRHDRDVVNDCLRSLDRPLAALQAQIDDFGQLPAAFPPAPQRLGVAYASDLVREYARQANGPVIIANSVTTPMILRSDANGVVIYENGKVRSEWWSRSRFLHNWIEQSTQVRKWDQSRRAEAPNLP